jgi:hypothetical protein
MEQYFGVRRAWVIAVFASVGACGLSTAGEKIVTGEAFGGGDASADDDGGAVVGSDGSPINFEDGGGYTSDDGAVSEPDSLPPGTCDFAGTWGTLIQIVVDWAPMGLSLQTFILAPGQGMIKQWVKGVRVQHGTSVADTTVVCGIDLPDFQGTALVNMATYGVVFPAALFDKMVLPTFQVDATVTASAPDAGYQASASAALLGLTMANPTTDPWPATVTTATDPDNDGNPGVTIAVAQGGQYSAIPVGVPGIGQPVVTSDKLYVAIRQITELAGTFTDCNHASGSVSIPQIDGQYAINSHILGCELSAGGNCTASGTSSQASFVDNTQPVFTPSAMGTATFTSLRLPDGATCATVREMLQ